MICYITCRICDKKFKSTRKEAKYCSHSCSAKGTKNRLGHKKERKIFILVCLSCRKEFSIIDTKEPRKRFCSRKCASLNASKMASTNLECRKKRSLTLKGKTWEEISPQTAKYRKTGKVLFCEQCRINIGYRKKSSIDKNRHNFCSSSCREKYIWEHRTPEEKSEWLKNSARSGNRKTRPEIIIENILSKNFSGWEYAGNGKYHIDKYHPDFINRIKKKIIEHYGDYWHKDDNPQDRIKLFKQFGYDTLVIWEHEVYELSETEIVNKINLWNPQKTEVM